MCCRVARLLLAALCVCKHYARMLHAYAPAFSSALTLLPGAARPPAVCLCSYKAAAQQLQQHMTAYPMGPGAVQMAPMAGGAPAGYPQQPMMAAPQQQAAPPGPPAGYPTAWTPPPAQPAGAAFYQPGPAPPGAPPTGANAV